MAKFLAKYLVAVILLGASSAQASEIKIKMFFNHKCPCSHRLIGDIMKSLKPYSEKVSTEFYLTQEANKDFLVKLQKAWGLPAEIVIDHDKKIAKSFGIVATPEMVIHLGKEQVYRGAVVEENFEDPLENRDMLKIVLSKLTKGSRDFPKEAVVSGCPLDEGTLIFPEE